MFQALKCKPDGIAAPASLPLAEQCCLFSFPLSIFFTFSSLLVLYQPYRDKAILLRRLRQA